MTILRIYGKRHSQFDHPQEVGKKSQKMHTFLQEEIDIDNQIEKEYDHKNANYYDSPMLDYYEPDAFN